jgi:hypothetical protein
MAREGKLNTEEQSASLFMVKCVGKELVELCRQVARKVTTQTDKKEMELGLGKGVQWEGNQPFPGPK